MQESMNVPYVKQFNSNGEVLNPIKGSYLNEYANRRTRRNEFKKEKFYGESKNHHLTIVQTGKYLRRKQPIIINGKVDKVIEHYDLQK